MSQVRKGSPLQFKRLYKCSGSFNSLSCEVFGDSTLLFVFWNLIFRIKYFIFVCFVVSHPLTQHCCYLASDGTKCSGYSYFLGGAASWGALYSLSVKGWFGVSSFRKDTNHLYGTAHYSWFSGSTCARCLQPGQGISPSASDVVSVFFVIMRYFLMLRFCDQQKLISGMFQISQLSQFTIKTASHASVSRLCHSGKMSMRQWFTPLLRRLNILKNWYAGSCDLKLAQPYNKKADGPTDAEKKAKRPKEATKVEAKESRKWQNQPKPSKAI